MSMLADTLWPSIAATVVVLLVLGLSWFLRPTIRQDRHLRAVLRGVAVVAAVQLILVSIYFIALVSDMPPINEF